MENGKAKTYTDLMKQVESLIAGETDETAVLANVTAAMASAFPHWLWTGFYLVRDGVLTVGPFQGPVACFRIKKGRGVCGTAWERDETIVVPDVEKFPGHIACSSLSRSEIVVPMHDTDGNVVGVLDVDSPELGTFDHEDSRYMEQIVLLLSANLYKK
jgi:L-methionine (R)-S-oxide reductase